MDTADEDMGPVKELSGMVGSGSTLLRQSRMVVLTGLLPRMGDVRGCGSSYFAALEPSGGWGRTMREGACEETCEGARVGVRDLFWDGAREGALDGATDTVTVCTQDADWDGVMEGA